MPLTAPQAHFTRGQVWRKHSMGSNQDLHPIKDIDSPYGKLNLQPAVCLFSKKNLEWKQDRMRAYWKTHERFSVGF